MSGLSELIMDIAHIDSNSKNVASAQETTRDITDRVNNGEDVNEAVKKMLITTLFKHFLSEFF